MGEAKHRMGRKRRNTKQKTVYMLEEINNVIDEFYPEGTDAEHNLMKLNLILQSRGSSLKKILEKRKSKDSPFISFPSRD